MGKRSPAHVLWTEGPAAFSFLVEKYGFSGPHVVEPHGHQDHGGLRYEKPNLLISIGVWSWHQGERGITTKVRMYRPDVDAHLGAVYAMLGLGPERDVPAGGGSGHVVRKRIGEHAAVLREVVPLLENPDLTSKLAEGSSRHLGSVQG
ncbi:hypothetical protein ABZX92_02545 [Lentzea sp. NPDC006480]|uniref:hypothetical protein n=1 Tax=Lentzea sp. NPDC006480 TaxID=3157176 RepID=UPI0033BD327E